MHPLLAHAVAEAAPLIGSRGWLAPSDMAIAEAERLLGLVAGYRAPLVQAEPDGTLAFEWESEGRGWLRLTVNGQGLLTHSAVIEQDEFERTEAFGDVLPDWAAKLLRDLLGVEH